MKHLFTTLLALLVFSAAHAQTDCSDLFFSEYIEGSSNNKGLEIFNPSKGTIDLTGYVVALFSNGSTNPSYTLALKGKLASGATYHIVNSSANATIKAFADTTHSVTFYNGDDAVVLGKVNGMSIDTLDVIGIVGQDPGTNWKVGTGATSEYTLVRAESVKAGTPRWKVGATQWDVYAQDEFSYFGSHTSDCMKSTSAQGLVDFDRSAYSVGEAGAGLAAVVSVDTVSPNDTVRVHVWTEDGTAAINTHYTFDDTVLIFTHTSLIDTVEVGIMDNPIYQGDLMFSLILEVQGANASGGLDTAAVTIMDDEYPWVSIAKLRETDSTGAILYSGKKVWSGGIVNTATSFNASSLNIHFQSGGHGMGMFFSQPGYTPQVGDSIIILGTVSQYNGLAQFGSADSFAVISSGNPVVSKVVTTLDESTESLLITIKDLVLVDPGQWKSSGSFNVDITNGVDTFVMRIDSDTDIDGQPAPGVAFSLTGVGGQFDSQVPRFEGYQILPRNMMDINLSEYDLTIAQVRQNDSSGNPLYLGRVVRTRGVVNTGASFNGSGIQISMQSAGWGITLYGSGTDYGYGNFAFGDSIEVLGTLRQYNGLAEIDFIDTIIVHATGLLIEPVVVDTLDETAESKLIKFEKVQLVDTMQWKQSGSFNATFAQGANNFALRVDSDTDIPGMWAPKSTFDLIGIGGQFDGTLPFDGGYQLFPRSRADVVLPVSVAGQLNDGLRVYPNPTSGKVFIDGATASVSVEVYNLVGTRVLSFANVQNGLDLSALPKGMYILDASSNGSPLFTRRVIKN
ncbi:MAG: lamin tail domain-containing protein [Bacteroidetes bacterium]|nr:lamin tail domain-containing protein [Bacteroidota bacterium]